MIPELNRIYQGDCLEIMRGWPDKCVDLIVTDPPYGIGADVGQKKRAGLQHGNAAAKSRDYGQTNWDSKIPSREVFSEMFRVSKNQIIFGGNYFTEILPPSSCWVAWDKRVLDSMRNDYADCELAWTSFDKPARMVRFMWMGMIQNNMKEKEERHHPTQKPVRVMEQILEMFSQQSDIICDPFAGSGTTAIAADKIGRAWVGCEIEPQYIAVAQSRLDAERAQGRLF